MDCSNIERLLYKNLCRYGNRWALSIVRHDTLLETSWKKRKEDNLE